jgi:hypothetical protein
MMPQNESEQRLIAKIEGISVAFDKPAMFSFSPTYTNQIKTEKPGTKIFLMRHTHDTRGLEEKAMETRDCVEFTRGFIEFLNNANIVVKRPIGHEPNMALEFNFSDPTLESKIDAAWQTISRQITKDTANVIRRKIALDKNKKPLDPDQAASIIVEHITTLHAIAEELGINNRVKSKMPLKGGRSLTKMEDDN